MDARAVEAQRLEHLVFGKPRPKPPAAGKKSRRARPATVTLAPGIEEQVALREAWSHKQGTPQTLEHAARTRQGALARLYQSGTLTAEQLASGEAIREAAHRCTAEVLIRTASLETRVDSTPRFDATFYEALGAVRSERAYTDWRAEVAVRAPIGAVLDMIVGDCGVTIVARLHGMHVRRATRLLIEALDLWPAIRARAARMIDPATLAAAQAAIL